MTHPPGLFDNLGKELDMSIKQISKKKWLLDYSVRDENKKQHRIQKTVYGSYDDAQREYRKIKDGLLNKIHANFNCSGDRLTMEQMASNYLEYIKEMGKSLWGVQRNVNFAVEFFGADTPVRELKPYQLIEYRKWHKKRNPKLKPATINRAMAYLRAMINKAVEYQWGGLKDSPIKKYPMVHEERKPKGYMSPEDVQALVDNADSELRDIIYVLIYTGNRKNEVLNLRWDQVDFKNRMLIFRTKDSKRQGRILTKPIGDQLLKLLEKRQERNLFVKSEFVFPEPDNPGLPRKSIRSAWNRACKKAGLVNVTPHILRHTFASWLVMETGGDMKVVSRLVGHSGIQITNDYYAHLSEDYLRSKVNIIGNILPLKKTVSS